MQKLLIIIAMLTLTATAHAQSFDCHGPRFRGEGPEINEVHIFCGEIRNGRDEGYHSELIRSPLVEGVERVRPIGRHGVYEGEVRFTNGGVHRSTFFPRHCSIPQIETSIRYAAAHKFFGNHGDWSFGPSAPLEGGPAYCVGDDGKSLQLQLAVTERGGVNTAFPEGRR